MDSFQAKIGWKRSRKRKKNYRFDPFQPDEYQKIQKKLKKTIMASFQGKMGWKCPRKGENKNYRPDPFQHNV